MTGTMNRHRFSLKYADGTIRRFGCCDPKVDDNYDVDEFDGVFFLVHKDKRGDDYSEVGREVIPMDTLATNGYYDHEHDGWIPIWNFA
jgi:hypothetical protein